MSGIYASAGTRMLSGTLNWTSGSFAVMLVGPGYTPDYGSDTTLNDIPSGSRLLGSPVALSGEAVSGGYAQADSVTLDSLTTTAAIVGVAILQNNSGTWDLVCYIDQAVGLGQAVTSAPVNLIWDSRGIFRP